MEHLETQVSDLRYLAQAPTRALGAIGSLSMSVPSPSTSEPSRDPHSASSQSHTQQLPPPYPAQHSHHSAHSSLSHQHSNPHSHPPPPPHPYVHHQDPQAHQQHGISPTGSSGPQNTLAPYQGNMSVGSSQIVSSQGAGSSMAASSRGTDSAIGAKRKLDDSGAGEDQTVPQKQQRSKRNRYISLACNECKRRKIKCNGETPCQRCGNLNLACLYAPNCCANNFKDSEEFKNMSSHLSRLQEQLDNLTQTVTTIKSETARLSAAPSTHLPPGIQQHYQPPSLPPPTSTAITLPPPTSSLQQTLVSSPAASSTSLQKIDPSLTIISGTSSVKGLGLRGPSSYTDVHGLPHSHHSGTDHAPSQSGHGGYRSVIDNGSIGHPESYNPHAHAEGGYRHNTAASPPEDPLWDLSIDEIIRLCRLYDEECGVLSPMLSVNSVIAHARSLISFMENTSKDRGIALNDDKTMLLKIVVCCGMAVEDHGYSERAAALYESMESKLNKKLMADDVAVSDITILALMAGYRYLINNDVLAWRIMGQVARLCIEIGLNTKQGINLIAGEEDRKMAILAFWAVFILDRRWSICAGLPFVLTNDVVEHDLPVPEDQKSMVSMIHYSRLASQVWRSVTNINATLVPDLSSTEAYDLDMQIRRWYDTVPEEVKVSNWNKEQHTATTPSYNLQRLRVWTYLRLNQLRIWIYMHFLKSPGSIKRNQQQAKLAVDLAKDSTRYLTHLNTTTPIYRRVQVYYQNFLSSILATLFLACAHAPSQFLQDSRQDFYAALDLARDIHQKSWVSKRIWRAIVRTRDMAPRLGVRLQAPHDPTLVSIAGTPGSASGSSGPSGQVPYNSGHDDPHLGPPTNRQGPVLAPLGRSHSILKSTPLSNSSQSIGSAPLISNEALSNGAQLRAELTRLFEGYISSRYASSADEYSMSPDRYGDSEQPSELFTYLKELY